MAKIFWSEKSIPALQGLTFSERSALKRTVVGKVWKHWQIWLPFFLFGLCCVAFFQFAPAFPYRMVVVVGSVLVFSRIMAVPFNAYLHRYLSNSPAGV